MLPFVAKRDREEFACFTFVSRNEYGPLRVCRAGLPDMLRSSVTLSLLLVVSVGLAEGQSEGRTSFVLEAHMDGEGTYWTFEGETAKNPTLVVPAGATISVTVRNVDPGVHNIQVEGQPESEYVENEGDMVTYEFTAPSSGSTQYWCVPHKSSGMVGRVQVAGSEGPAETNGAPGPGAALVVLALAAGVALIRRR